MIAVGNYCNLIYKNSIVHSTVHTNLTETSWNVVDIRLRYVVSCVMSGCDSRFIPNN